MSALHVERRHSCLRGGDRDQMRKTECRTLSGGELGGGETAANVCVSALTATTGAETCAIAVSDGATYRETAFTVASSDVMTHSLPGHASRLLFIVAPAAAWQHGIEHIVAAA